MAISVGGISTGRWSPSRGCRGRGGSGGRGRIGRGRGGNAWDEGRHGGAQGAGRRERDGVTSRGRLSVPPRPVSHANVSVPRVEPPIHNVVRVVRPAIDAILGQQAEGTTTAGRAAGKGVRRVEASRGGSVAARSEVLAKGRARCADDPADGARIVAGSGRGLEAANRVSSGSDRRGRGSGKGSRGHRGGQSRRGGSGRVNGC